jgi:hypothetical protein
MVRLLFSVITPLVAILSDVAAAQNNHEAKQVRLWAALSISQPVFSACENGIANLQINFGMVNDGHSTVDPKIGSSQLLINGKEAKGWSMVINNGPRTSDFVSLRPGRSLNFGIALKEYFMNPGVYTAGWRGEKFKAQPIMFRVLPCER